MKIVKNNPSIRRFKSMLSIDFRRMFTQPLFYICLGVAFVIPILVLVMTTTMGGTTGPRAEVEAVEAFTNVWQAIGTLSNTSSSGEMSIMSMCNMNMIYFLVAIFTVVFTSADFSSGYCKNLFTIRAKKTDYVFSKSCLCFMSGMLMLLVYFVGAILGGKVAGLSFEMEGFNASNLVMCLFSKIFVGIIFVSLSLLASTFAKQKTWLSILIALGVCMLLFNMVPMITPLDSSVLHVGLCFAGGFLFAFGIGFFSDLVLRKTNLI